MAAKSTGKPASRLTTGPPNPPGHQIHFSNGETVDFHSIGRRAHSAATAATHRAGYNSIGARVSQCKGRRLPIRKTAGVTSHRSPHPRLGPRISRPVSISAAISPTRFHAVRGR